MIDAEGRRDPRRLTDNPFADWDPVWSPDGEHIAFTSGKDRDPVVGGHWGLYVMAADGKNRRKLTGDSFAAGYPAWSADGKRIAFVSSEVWNIASGNLANLRDGGRWG